ncbi:glutathione binding-like protein [Agrobacterium vitis]|uniref:Glutathione S-transferase N-terminal domain-containing protein n=1 Tax=Agrobacterium vitis TaxID=373 RepID=A0AAE2UQP9_AGRVI|nr:glutathione binding-like protein [Agrobacterium vitis]MBF2713358.1 glutathione S-transferase N-terminal domain-containing protein [Agrobacterium vitis]MVA18419.1 glutathione S-transferase [Agrobacterium vitis]
MTDLSSFPITKRWPAQNPEIIQLYSLPTPNGVKVSIALEELDLPYEAHLVTFSDNSQKSPEFVSLNPNGRIPAILDPHGPDGKPVGVFESGAILVYLAEKTGRLLPKDGPSRYSVLQWLFFQMGGVGPMFGQFGHFHKYAADKVANNSYPTERYRDETRRLLSVLEAELAHRPWLAGDEYSIADIATWPWVRCITAGYEAAEVIGLSNYPAVMDWAARGEARPASQKGLNIPPRPV